MITLTFTLKEAKGLMDGLREVQDALEGEFNCGSDIVEDLVWQIVDRDHNPVCRRLFSSKRYAEDYMYHMMNRFDHVIPIWVDGWYDEQYSWKRAEVKGYEGRMSLEDKETIE